MSSVALFGRVEQLQLLVKLGHYNESPIAEDNGQRLFYFLHRRAIVIE